MKTLDINIPFKGFYNSVYSDMIDSQLEQWAEHEAGEREKEWPKHLRLDESKLSEILFYAVNYSAAHLAIAKDYCAAFDEMAGDALGISFVQHYKRRDWKSGKDVWHKTRRDSIKLQFAEMTSPREFNFATDRIFASIPFYIAQRLFKMSRDDGHRELSNVIAERFTSYDGFISGYSNRLADWLATPLAAWDHNELGTLLIACLELQGADWGDRDLTLYYATSRDDGGYQAFSDAVEWAKLDSDIDEARAELLTSWIDDEPGAAGRWMANNAEKAAPLVALLPSDVALPEMPYRCTMTPDMFAGLGA